MRDALEDVLDQWMARLAEGDREAFDPLYRQLHPRAIRLARARLGEEHAADIAQAVLLRVFSRASEFVPGAPVLPWFYAIAANELRTVERRLKKAKQRTVSEEHLTILPSPDDPERAMMERELKEALSFALARLDRGSSEALNAMLDRGARPAVDPPTFRKRVSRAYAKLRMLLGESHAG